MTKSQTGEKTLTDDTFHFFLQNNDGLPLTYQVGYSTGKTINCPKCNSEKVCIFFKRGFNGVKRMQWYDFLNENNFKLCSDWEIIKKHDFNPNWICKDCFDGGVVIDE